MRVAVIVATYNAAANLPRCIESILGQTAPGVGAIVVDGGSTDATRQILEHYADRLLWWCSEPDGGIYDAWNKGLAARGEADWICFLGADDAFCDPSAVEALLPTLATAAPAHRLVYGDLEVTDGDDRLLDVRHEPWERARRRIGETLTIPHPGLMHHRSIFDLRGGFDAGFRMAGDYDLVLRELAHTEPLHVPGRRVVRWQEGGVTTDASMAGVATQERNRALRQNGYPPASWYMRSGLADRVRFLLRRLLGTRHVRNLQRLWRRLG